jgi:hypothetical protein
VAGFVDPNTVQDAAAGQPLQAARLDADRTALMYLATNHCHMRVYKSTNQTVVNATRTGITHNTERVDVGAMHSTVTNTSRGTVPTGEGGFFDAGGGVSWTGNATGSRNTEIRLNGTTLIAVQSDSNLSAVAFEQNVNTKYQLAAGDYLELTVLQSSGGNLDVIAGGNYSPEFWMEWSAT